MSLRNKRDEDPLILAIIFFIIIILLCVFL